MKKTGFRNCLLWVFACLIFSAQAITSYAQTLTAADFSKLPKIESVRMSPDGKKLLYLQDMDNNTYLVNFDLETRKMTKVSVVDNVAFMFRYAIWANNDIVLFSVIAPYDRDGIPTYETRLLVRKADASDEYRELIKIGAVRSSYYDYFSQVQDNIISMLPDDPDHILMGIDGKKPGEDTVYKVNIKTSELTEVQARKKMYVTGVQISREG